MKKKVNSVNSKNVIFKKAPNTISKVLVDGSRSIIDMDDFKNYFKVDKWAAEFWDLTDGKRSQSEIAEEICKKSQLERAFVDEQIELIAKDLVEFKLLEKVSR